LNTPFEDQSIIPDFDTAELSESYNNLFATNRFSGFDRIGDADQFTLAIGSRIISTRSGEELFNFALGQIHYRQDRRVSLDNTIATNSKSNLIMQVSLTPTPNWRVSSNLVRRPDKTWSKKNLSIHYQDQGFAANIEYFFTDQELEQYLVSAAYPLNDRWTIVAKYHQSLLDPGLVKLGTEETVENLFGLSYESCCWGLKILASQTSDDNFIEIDRTIYIELTLKGLGQVGQNIDTRLRNSIPGYQAQF
jgi:LPS-assembly protein